MTKRNDNSVGLIENGGPSKFRESISRKIPAEHF